VFAACGGDNVSGGGSPPSTAATLRATTPRVIAYDIYASGKLPGYNNAPGTIKTKDCPLHYDGGTLVTATGGGFYEEGKASQQSGVALAADGHDVVGGVPDPDSWAIVGWEGRENTVRVFVTCLYYQD